MKKQTIIPPEGGWKPRSFYLVEVSYSSVNPVHKDIFYTGFLDEGFPSGYNYLSAQGEPNTISEVYYLKVIRLLVSEKEFKGKCSKFMPDDKLL